MHRKELIPAKVVRLTVLTATFALCQASSCIGKTVAVRMKLQFSLVSWCENGGSQVCLLGCAAGATTMVTL